MKPNTSQANGATAQFSFKPHQFLCAKSASGTTTAYTTTNGGMPMKVLLVNTLQKPPAASTPGGTVTVSASGIITSQSMTNPINTRPVVSIQPKTANLTGNQLIQSTYRTRSTTAATATAQGVKGPTVFSTNKYLCSNQAPQPDTSSIKRPLSFKSGKASPGFRTLLNQLVQMQSKQLEVSKQRLDLERERLEFEKSTADRIITAMTSLLAARSGDDTKDEK